MAARGAIKSNAAMNCTAHDKAFWRAIVNHDYALSADASPAGLLDELDTYLGSPDPELRDEFGYAITATWIYRKHLLKREVLLPLMTRWTANLRNHIGEQNTDSVFLRSFSALSLSIAIALDNEVPFLRDTEFRSVLTAALEYLMNERDIRGFEREKGWIHSAAHTADLLKFAARSRYLQRADQARILEAIAMKLRTVADVFTHGEGERLARAALSIVMRSDFDSMAFHDWVMRCTPPPDSSAAPTAAAIRWTENIRHLFTSLHALLRLTNSETKAAAEARRSVLDGLRHLF